MKPLFGYYVMVDWSGGNRRRANADNCIWIAHGRSEDQAPVCLSPHSRSEATGLVNELLVGQVSGRPSERALVCFDFPYAYPSGLAEHLPAIMPQEPDIPWRRVWTYLSENVRDDLGTRGVKPSNRSNRFEVANNLNQSICGGGIKGPFWCTDKPQDYPSTPQNKPAKPFSSSRGVTIHELRLADRYVDADWPFRLFGHGSVGSQLIVGIPRLSQLRYAEALKSVSLVWPFETGWAGSSSEGWLPEITRIVHAEIYPSVREPLVDVVKDRGQVRAMWTWARDTDRAGQLQARFAIPAEIKPGSPEDQTVCREEGWILH
jgi:hypothetical protein